MLSKRKKKLFIIKEQKDDLYFLNMKTNNNSNIELSNDNYI